MTSELSCPRKRGTCSASTCIPWEITGQPLKVRPTGFAVWAARRWSCRCGWRDLPRLWWPPALTSCGSGNWFPAWTAWNMAKRGASTRPGKPWIATTTCSGMSGRPGLFSMSLRETPEPKGKTTWRSGLFAQPNSSPLPEVVHVAMGEIYNDTESGGNRHGYNKLK